MNSLKNIDAFTFPEFKKFCTESVSTIIELMEEKRQLELQVDYFQEQYRLLNHKIYGRSAEQQLLSKNQGSLFEEDNSLVHIDSTQPEEHQEEQKEPENKKAKLRGKRTKLPNHLPRIDNFIDLSEEEKQCACGHNLEKIGEKTSEKIHIIPAQVSIQKIIRPQYACKACEGVEDPDKPTVRIAPAPHDMIPKSQATHETLAHIIISKFVDALPFYRQQEFWKRENIHLPRQTMARWVMNLSETLQPFLGLFLRVLLQQNYLLIDETPFQVLNEPEKDPSSKSYMWVIRSGPPDKPLIYFHYASTRSGSVPQELLSGFQGVVQSDGYSGYAFLASMENISHAGCLNHCRRKFIEVEKSLEDPKNPPPNALYRQALDFIAQVYHLEKQAEELKIIGPQLVLFRQKRTAIVMESFSMWLNDNQMKVPPESLLGKAINYTMNQWDKVLVFINHAELTPDTNLVENAIRPFAVGRKNWLFNSSVEGAKASALFYSLIETAKASGLNPYKYLCFLFDNFRTELSEEQMIKLLPQNIDPKSL